MTIRRFETWAVIKLDGDIAPASDVMEFSIECLGSQRQRLIPLTR